MDRTGQSNQSKNKVVITAANIADAKGLDHVYPKQGAVYEDKAYCVKSVVDTAAKKGCHLASIQKKYAGKNRDLDHYYSVIRSPYERVFSKQNKRVRYCGVEKN